MIISSKSISSQYEINEVAEFNMENVFIFTRDQLEKIYTINESEFEKYKGKSEDFKILITPFDVQKLQPASYDISVGDHYYNLTTGSDKIDIVERGSLTVEPNECIRIRTRETIGIPYNCSALVTTKISLSMVGLLQVTSRIDPGFKGKLDITLFNAGKKKVSLRYEDTFANLVFFRLGIPVSKAYSGTPRPKATDDYSPILREEVKGNMDSYIASLLKSGSPFDVIAHLLEIRKEASDREIETLKNTIMSENRIYKFITYLLLAIGIGSAILKICGLF